MTKIGYSGTLETFRIKVSGVMIKWSKNEIRNVSEKDTERLLLNKDFYLAEGKKEKKVKAPKKEEKIEEVRDVEVLKEPTKDELLDYTAINGIEADYSMTVEELKEAIKTHEDGE